MSSTGFARETACGVAGMVADEGVVGVWERQIERGRLRGAKSESLRGKQCEVKGVRETCTNSVRVVGV